MKSPLSPILGLILVPGASVLALPQQASVLGDWACEVHVDSNGQTYPFTLNLEEKAEILSGTASSEMGSVELEALQYSEGTLTFQISLAETGTINFELKIEGQELTGRCGNYDFEGTVKGQKK